MDEKKIVDAILKYAMLWREGLPTNLTILADCRDYFMYKMLDVMEGDRDSAIKFIKEMDEYTRYCEKKGDHFHAGFFFTLGQLVQIKKEIPMMEDEKITRKDFEESWKITKRKIGIF